MRDGGLFVCRAKTIRMWKVVILLEAPERFAALDGLRAVFSAGIVIYHVNTMFDSAFSSLLTPVYTYGGYFGNYFLFILSGLLTAWHYKERLAKGEMKSSAFLKQRLIRLYPIYFLSNLVIMASGTVAISPRRTFATFLMMSTGWFFKGDTPYNLPAWFLCVLMICWLIYCLIARLSGGHSAVYAALCTLILLGGAFLEKADCGIPFLYRVCGEGYMNFFLGVLLAEWLGPNVPQVSPGRRRAAAGILCIILSAAVFSLRSGFRALPGDTRWWISLLCAGLTAAVLTRVRPANVLSFGPLPALGKRSFSLLLWHVPLARYWQRIAGLLPSVRISFLLYLLAAAAVSFVSYRYLESAGRRS